VAGPPNLHVHCINTATVGTVGATAHTHARTSRKTWMRPRSRIRAHLPPQPSLPLSHQQTPHFQPSETVGNDLAAAKHTSQHSITTTRHRRTYCRSRVRDGTQHASETSPNPYNGTLQTLHRIDLGARHIRGPEYEANATSGLPRTNNRLFRHRRDDDSRVRSN
jgi:hypothetical protein